MIQLEKGLVNHLGEVDYFDSELLVLRNVSNSGQVQLCLFDLSEIFPEILGCRTAKRDYAFRYKFFLFDGVQNLIHSEREPTASWIENGSFCNSSGGFLVDHFKAAQEGESLKVSIACDRGFGMLEFTTNEEPEIYEMPLYSFTVEGVEKLSIAPDKLLPIAEEKFFKHFFEDPFLAITSVEALLQGG